MIKVLFTTQRKLNFGSLFIRSSLGMDSPFSHCSILIYHDFFKTPLVYEVAKFGVNNQILKEFEKKSTVIDEFLVTTDANETLKAIEFLTPLLGKKFCFTTLFSVWGRFKFNLPLKISNLPTNSFTCSELVFYTLQDYFSDCPYINNKSFNPRILSPRDIYWMLLSKSDREQVISLKEGVIHLKAS